MRLGQCPDCGAGVSKSAAVCMRCGRDMRQGGLIVFSENAGCKILLICGGIALFWLLVFIIADWLGFMSH